MKKFIALVVMLCAVLVSSTASAAADWVWVCSNEYFTIYADNNSIRRDYNHGGYVFCAFTKEIYSEEGRTTAIESYRSKGKTVPQWLYNMSYLIKLQYFKEENGFKYFGFLFVVLYDHDGNVIDSSENSYSEIKWSMIPPGSMLEKEFDVIRARVPN